MIDQLVEKIKKTKAPVVVGLDPMLSYIPEWILKDAISKYGETMEAVIFSAYACHISIFRLHS